MILQPKFPWNCQVRPQEILWWHSITQEYLSIHHVEATILHSMIPSIPWYLPVHGTFFALWGGLIFLSKSTQPTTNPSNPGTNSGFPRHQMPECRSANCSSRYRPCSNPENLGDFCRFTNPRQPNTQRKVETQPNKIELKKRKIIWNSTSISNNMARMR